MAVEETPITTVTLLTYSGILGLVSALVGAWLGGIAAKSAQEHALKLARQDRRIRIIDLAEATFRRIKEVCGLFTEWDPHDPLPEHSMASLENICAEFNRVDGDLYLVGDRKLELAIRDVSAIALRWAILVRVKEAEWSRQQESVTEGPHGLAQRREADAFMAMTLRRGLAEDLAKLVLASDDLLARLGALHPDEAAPTASLP
jgi:hypothetical protein